MVFEEILKNAYQKYVKDWCETRGYAPLDVDSEIGINGECYACINEFEQNEFQDRSLMRRLLTDEEFMSWDCRKPFKFIYQRGLIYQTFIKQKAGMIGECPRCGGKMNDRVTLNSLSRRTDIYICNSCGMQEAIEDAKKAKDPAFEKMVIEEWHLVRKSIKELFESPILRQ